MRQASSNRQSASISTLTTTGAYCACLTLGFATVTSAIAPAQNLQEKIVFSAAFEEGDEVDLWMMNPDGSELTNLTEDINGNTYAPRISPDGANLAYVMRLNGQDTLSILNIAQGVNTSVREFTGFDWIADWYNTETILYRYDNFVCSADYHLVDTAGNELGLLIDMNCFGQGASFNANVSPDGTKITLDAQTGCWDPTFDIYITDLNGANCQVIYEDQVDNYRDYEPIWAPNSRDIYWVHTVDPGLSENRAIWAAIDAGTPDQQIIEIRQAEEDVWFGGFSPNGDLITLFYRDRLNTTDQWFTFNTSTGTEKLLIEGFDLDGLDWGFVDLGGSAGLDLAEPVPGVGGQLNSFSISNAPAGEQVYLAYGFIPGTQAVPGCPGVSLDIFRPTLAGSGIANIDGEVDITLFVPAGVTGRRTLLQAVERDACTKSSLLDYLWR